MAKKVLIIGAGLGGLATALRLATKGYQVQIIEKDKQAGGRLNQLKDKGFTFDMGPSFFSMRYEFDELFADCGVPNPLVLTELDPLYAVFFSYHSKPFLIQKNLRKMAEEFAALEPNFEEKAREYLRKARAIFEDTEHLVIKRNFDSKLAYLLTLCRVPLKHTPKLLKTMWKELDQTFVSEEVKVIFSLVAFFLGSTPFQTPAVYSLLNYTELQHDGYWNVQGGMYRIVEELLKLLHQRGVEIIYNTEVRSFKKSTDGTLDGFYDQTGRLWQADIYVSNGDAAAFRGQVMNRVDWSEQKLDSMQWTLAPFTIYLGIEGKLPMLHHHNYFLRDNFKVYADAIFKQSVAPENPYYYVNVSSRSNPDSAPEGCENLFILCPVPDLRYKPNWNDTEELAQTIIADLSKRIGVDLKPRTVTQTVMNPVHWQNKFNLYRGSGLGLAHNLGQVGGFRPANTDEEFSNLFYVGASTVPGTGLPIVVISSKLVTERILAQDGRTV